MRKYSIVVTGGIVLAVSLLVWGRLVGAKRLSQPPPAALVGSAGGRKNEVRHPLEIEAMRQRQYVGSEIQVEQDLGDKDGYHEFIVSYVSDGLKLYCLMGRPDTAKPAGGWPVVVLEHGYILPSDYRTDGPEYQSFMVVLAKSGYLVFKPDYRGHGQSQGEPLGGHFSPVYDYDVLNLISSIKKYSEANQAKIGQLGHSLGGHIALNVAVVSPDIKASLIAAGVVGSAFDLFYSWPNPTYVNDRPAKSVQGALQTLIDQQGDPKQNPDFWDKVSAINYVKYLQAPVQIHHGTADAVVPKLFSDKLDAALKAAGKQDEYFVYEGGDHQFSAPEVRSLFLQRMIEFFDRNLK